VGVPVSLSLIAKDYLSISDQLYIFKSDPLVESVSLGGMQSSGDGSIGFSLNLVGEKKHHSKKWRRCSKLKAIIGKCYIIIIEQNEHRA